LGFDGVAQRFLEAAYRLTRSVGRLAVKFLRGAGGLIRQAFSLSSGVTGDPAQILLNLSAKIASGAFHAIFIHSYFLL
jgi:hypothetical protein